MADKDVDQVPSQMALFAALRRALANKEYKNQKFGPDDLADIFLPAYFRFFLRFKKIQENTKAKLEGALPGVGAYMIARTRYFDDLFSSALKEKVPQIVLLGAGYDSRAYRFAGLNQGTRIFELDNAPTQERKRACLKKAQVAIPPQVHFVPIDFNREALGDVLEKAGCQDREKTLFIWEGVTYYLDQASVEVMLAFVSQVAHPGSVIAFDYTVTLNEQNMDAYYGAAAFAQSMAEHHAGEALMFSVDVGAIESLLKQNGLKMIEHLDNEQIEQRYLRTDSGNLIGRMTGHFRFVQASS